MSDHLTDEQQLALMYHAKRLAAIYDEYAQGTGDHLHRVNEISPRRVQTRNGFFLEFYDGSPYTLWTPWGAWDFAVHSKCADLASFMARLTVREHFTRTGVDGPIYAILAIDGVTMPEPELRIPNQYTDSYVAVAQWKQFFAMAQ